MSSLQNDNIFPLSIIHSSPTMDGVTRISLDTGQNYDIECKEAHSNLDQ